MKELSHWENSQSKLTPNTNSDVKPINSEKIKSFEYDKWEAFNVEEALANLNSEQLISSTPTRNHPVLSAEDSLFEKEKGNAYFAKGKFKKAVQCYTKSIGLNPKFAASYLNRALAFIKLKM